MPSRSEDDILLQALFSYAIIFSSRVLKFCSRAGNSCRNINTSCFSPNCLLKSSYNETVETRSTPVSFFSVTPKLSHLCAALVLSNSMIFFVLKELQLSP